MGNKKRKKPETRPVPKQPSTTKLKLNKSTKEGLVIYADALRELLAIHKIPFADWNSIWGSLVDFPKLDADQDAQFICGWFAGVAESNGVEEPDLVKL